MDCFPLQSGAQATTVGPIAITGIPPDPPLETDAFVQCDCPAVCRTSHRDVLAMLSPHLRLRLAALNRLAAGFLILLPLLAGCCHTPTVNAHANVCADGHLVNE